MRLTKADLAMRLQVAEERINDMRRSSGMQAQEIRDIRTDRDTILKREKDSEKEWRELQRTNLAQYERDREALLTAENRIVALEDAIVSLAVRVA